MRFIICIALFIISTGLSAQNIDSLKVPKIARHRFDSIYPSLKNPTWQLNTDSLYIASIFMDGLSKKVFFTPDGKLKRVITDIPIGKCPQYLRDALDKKYAKNYQLLSLTADVKYADMAYRDEKTNELKSTNNYKLLDYTIKITTGGKIYMLDYNYNTHELMEQ